MDRLCRTREAARAATARRRANAEASWVRTSTDCLACRGWPWAGSAASSPEASGLAALHVQVASEDGLCQGSSWACPASMDPHSQHSGVHLLLRGNLSPLPLRL